MGDLKVFGLVLEEFVWLCLDVPSHRGRAVLGTINHLTWRWNTISKELHTSTFYYTVSKVKATV